MLTIDDKRRRESIPAQVGTEILKLRKQLDMSQETLAKRAGITRSYLSRVENGKVDLSISVLHAIATVLGRTISELLEDMG
jgi:putative transcriptional regulator